MEKEVIENIIDKEIKVYEKSIKITINALYGDSKDVKEINTIIEYSKIIALTDFKKKFKK